MSLGEFDIIARYFTRPCRRADILLGVGDDAAVLDQPADRNLVIAMDTLVEGVHFPESASAADVGYRAIAVNLSDLAAMGAQPRWMTLSLSLPRADERWLAGFAAGLFELADRYEVALVGGDTVRGPLVITVQIGGWVERDVWLMRSGARAGDLLFVSGVPGEAAAGLATIQRHMDGGEAGAHLRRRFWRPQPRVELGRTLRTIAGAAMDVSDGLLSDCEKLCAASGCGALIDLNALPASQSMRALFDENACMGFQLAGGDDYELLFTLAPERVAELRVVQGPLNATQIGVITAGGAVRCERGGRIVSVADCGGYDHFAAKDASR
ncbi:MAG TPA: thiamine-phosphate kinase [Steroidobacter sp.]|nr:thiamine-phosphate kinase [Steroidobacter sp.]